MVLVVLVVVVVRYRIGQTETTGVGRRARCTRRGRRRGRRRWRRIYWDVACSVGYTLVEGSSQQYCAQIVVHCNHCPKADHKLQYEQNADASPPLYRHGTPLHKP